MSIGYWGALAGVALVSLVALCCAVRTLLGGSWFSGWLRGNIGLVLLIVSVCLGLLGYDFSRYQTLRPLGTVATVSFSKTGPQQYQATLAQSQGGEYVIELEGDLWQLELRNLYWNKLLQPFGFNPSYRPHQLRGRYYLLEQEQQHPSTALTFDSGFYFVDLWQFLQSRGRGQTLLNSKRLQTVAMPMKDGALYAVKVSPSGELEVNPVNTQANSALTP